MATLQLSPSLGTGRPKGRPATVPPPGVTPARDLLLQLSTPDFSVRRPRAAACAPEDAAVFPLPDWPACPCPSPAPSA